MSDREEGTGRKDTQQSSAFGDSIAPMVIQVSKTGATQIDDLPPSREVLQREESLLMTQ